MRSCVVNRSKLPTRDNNNTGHLIYVHTAYSEKILYQYNAMIYNRTHYYCCPCLCNTKYAMEILSPRHSNYCLPMTKYCQCTKYHCYTNSMGLFMCTLLYTFLYARTILITYAYAYASVPTTYQNISVEKVRLRWRTF